MSKKHESLCDIIKDDTIPQILKNLNSDDVKKNLGLYLPRIEDGTITKIQFQYLIDLFAKAYLVSELEEESHVAHITMRIEKAFGNSKRYTNLTDSLFREDKKAYSDNHTMVTDMIQLYFGEGKHNLVTYDRIGIARRNLVSYAKKGLAFFYAASMKNQPVKNTLKESIEASGEAMYSEYKAVHTAISQLPLLLDVPY